MEQTLNKGDRVIVKESAYSKASLKGVELAKAKGAPITGTVIDHDMSNDMVLVRMDGKGFEHLVLGKGVNVFPREDLIKEENMEPTLKQKLKDKLNRYYWKIQCSDKDEELDSIANYLAENVNGDKALELIDGINKTSEPYLVNAVVSNYRLIGDDMIDELLNIIYAFIYEDIDLIEHIFKVRISRLWEYENNATFFYDLSAFKEHADRDLRLNGIDSPYIEVIANIDELIDESDDESLQCIVTYNDGYTKSVDIWDVVYKLYSVGVLDEELRDIFGKDYTPLD